MNKKLQKFIQKTQVKRSRFYEHKEEIFELKKLGYSTPQICEYLNSVGVDAKERNLNAWIQRNAMQKVEQVQQTVTTKEQRSYVETKKDETHSSSSTGSSLERFKQMALKNHSVQDLLTHSKHKNQD
ncbi:MAG: hypothetical protein WCY75_06965 [Sulfurimonadaceae bacterium]